MIIAAILYQPFKTRILFKNWSIFVHFRVMAQLVLEMVELNLTQKLNMRLVVLLDVWNLTKLMLKFIMMQTSSWKSWCIITMHLGDTDMVRSMQCLPVPLNCKNVRKMYGLTEAFIVQYFSEEEIYLRILNLLFKLIKNPGTKFKNIIYIFRFN